MRAFHEIRTPASAGSALLTIYQIDNLCFRAHWHQEVELLLVTEGEIAVDDQSGSHVLQKGDIAIFGSGDHHAYQTINQPARCILLIFSAGQLGSRIWPNGRRFVKSYAKADFLLDPDKIRDHKDLQSIVKDLLQNPQTNDDVGKHLALSSLHRLCGLLLRILPTAAWSDAEEKQLNNRLLRFQGMLERVEAQYRQEVTAQEMAKQLNLSYHHFTRLFTEYVGMGFQEFVNSKRLQDADEMLATTDFSITEVAFKCGFNSLRTFNRLYRNTYRCSPSDRR